MHKVHRASHTRPVEIDVRPHAVFIKLLEVSLIPASRLVEGSDGTDAGVGMKVCAAA